MQWIIRRRAGKAAFTDHLALDVSEPGLQPLATEGSAYAVMLHAPVQIVGCIPDLNILYLRPVEGMTSCSPPVSSSRNRTHQTALNCGSEKISTLIHTQDAYPHISPFRDTIHAIHCAKCRFHHKILPCFSRFA